MNGSGLVLRWGRTEMIWRVGYISLSEVGAHLDSEN
jgi:hypothetical protein